MRFSLEKREITEGVANKAELSLCWHNLIPYMPDQATKSMVGNILETADSTCHAMGQSYI